MTEDTENGDATKPSGPIEVWIRQMKLTGFTCMVVYLTSPPTNSTLRRKRWPLPSRRQPGG
jgi:hypothetical protein